MNRPIAYNKYLLEEMNATQVKDRITEKTIAIYWCMRKSWKPYAFWFGFYFSHEAC